MATVAFYAAGAAIGSALTGGAAAPVLFGLSGAALGGAAGGLLGGFIDSQVVMPLIFGSGRNAAGPRLDDLRVTAASEGTPVNYCFGPKNRVAGEYIWLANLKEVSHESGGGGKGGASGGGGSTTYTYYLSAAIAVCEAPASGAIVEITRIWVNGKVIYHRGVKDSRAKDIRIYKGNQTTADPLITAYEGTSPAYMGMVYVVLEDLDLTDFGNAAPNRVEFEVVAHNTITIGSALQELLARYGLDSTKVDVSNVPGCLQGYTIAGAVDGFRAVDPILSTFGITAAEHNQVLKFVGLGAEDIVDINGNDLAAVESGSSSENRPVQFESESEFNLPSEVNVTYLDTDTDLEQGSVGERRYGRTNRNVRNVSLPISLTPAEARTIAARILWSSWGERVKCNFSLPPSYLYVQEGDLVNIPFEGEIYPVRVLSVSTGSNFLRIFEGVVTQAQVLSHSSPIDVPPRTEGTAYTPPDLTWEVLDIPALSSEQLTLPSFYSAMCATDPDAQWKGGNLYGSRDSVNYSVDAVSSTESVMGSVSGTLADGPTTVWDTHTSIIVELLNGELESRTEDEVLAGFNFCLIGDEVLGYQTADLLSTGRYRISNLLRGRRGTEWATGTHSANERFVSLSSASVRVRTLSTGDIGTTWYSKGVAFSGNIASVTATTHVLQAVNLKPFSPVDVAGTRDGSNNLTVTWSRRTRAITRMFSSAPVPLQEDTESYTIEFLNGSNVVVRTVTATSPTTTYSAANQTSDGLTPGDPVKVKIYQNSGTVGRGTPASATV